jgi:hypothetical protein
MTEAEERVVKVLDVLCFTGKRHQKRIRGLSLFPKMMLDKCGKVIDIMERINAMFVCRKHKETVKEKINDKQTKITINNNNNNNNNHNKQFNIVFYGDDSDGDGAARGIFLYREVCFSTPSLVL